MTETRTLPDLDVVRTNLTACEYRDSSSDTEGLGLIDIRWSPFNTWYRIDSWWEGSFLERTVKGAFKRTMQAHAAAVRDDAHSIKTLFNHGMDMYVNDKLLGDIEELAEDRDSARSTVRLWDTSYNRDLLPGFRSGAYGASFMFRVVKEVWDNEPEPSDYNPDGLPERTIREARVFEAGPVTWPANPMATTAARCVSATDLYMDHLARRDPSRVASMRSRLLALRSGGPALITTGTPQDPGPAPAPPDDPAPRHSDGPALAHARARRLTMIEKGLSG